MIRVINRILKSFYLFALVYMLSQAPCHASINISKEIPDGVGPLLACLLSVAVVIVKSSKLGFAFKRIS